MLAMYIVSIVNLWLNVSAKLLKNITENEMYSNGALTAIVDQDIPSTILTLVRSGEPLTPHQSSKHIGAG